MSSSGSRHTHVPTHPQVPHNTEYVYEQQWHGLPAEEVEDLDDASINYDYRQDHSNQSNQFMTVRQCAVLSHVV
jgi:hypothetical protein